jgi:hypothetical protein
MKTFKILFSAVLILGITVSFSGCKKNDDTVKKPVCRFLTETIVGTGPSLRFSYNNDGKVSRIVVNNGTVHAFTYEGNITTIITVDSGAFRSRAIVTNNDAGLATNVRTEQDAAGTVWSNTKLEYNGEELAKSTNTSSTGSTPTITTYSWSNGNLVSETSGSGTINYEYYTDKLWQMGDYWSFVESIEGFEIVRNKNLLKSLPTNTLLTYDFGLDGNITSLKINSGSSVNFIDYEYECM